MDGTAPAYRHLHEENIKKAVEGKMFIEPYEIEMLRPDGNQIHVLAGYALLEGSKENGVAFLMDITLQKSLMAALELRVAERTKELNEANFALKQSNEDLLQFAHVASHDLKEPVRKIKTYGYRLQDELGNASEKAQSYVDKILSSASRMAAMIEGVLSYSTINASREMSGDVDLNLLLEDIRSDLEIVIQHKEAVVTSTKLPVFRGSRFLLYQLFLNLINNALKFSRADVTPRVNIDSTFINVSGEKHLQITIEDNGIGFEQANVERIVALVYSAVDIPEGNGQHVRFVEPSEFSLAFLEGFFGNLQISNVARCTGNGLNVSVVVQHRNKYIVVDTSAECSVRE